MNTSPSVSEENTPVPHNPAEPASESVNESTSGASRPAHVPEKFWDRQTGSINTDSLLKSYGELESRLGAPDSIVPDGIVPDSAEGYELSLDHPAIEPDPAVNSRLYAAGFSQSQAQLVYDLATEKLLPLMEEVSGTASREGQIERLENAFGGPQNWQQVSRQIGTWGRSNLPPDVMETLSSNYDGVMALHRLMTSTEPAMLGRSALPPSGLGEDELKQMMQDPRYWRDNDPGFVSRVRNGFEALYPD